MTGYTYRNRVYAIKRFEVEPLNKDSYDSYNEEKTVEDYHRKLY